MEKSKAFSCNNPPKWARISTFTTKPWSTSWENALTTTKLSLSNPPISRWPKLPREHSSKFSLIKSIGGGSQSESVSFVNLVVLHTRFQSSRMRLKEMLTKASQAEAQGKNRSETSPKLLPKMSTYPKKFLHFLHAECPNQSETRNVPKSLVSRKSPKTFKGYNQHIFDP